MYDAKAILLADSRKPETFGETIAMLNGASFFPNVKTGILTMNQLSLYNITPAMWARGPND